MNGLETVKAGDRVVVVLHHRYGGTMISGSFVCDHVTPNWIVGKGGSNSPFQRRIVIATGKEVGSKGYSNESFYPENHPYVNGIRMAQVKAIAASKLAKKLQDIASCAHDPAVMIAQLKALIAEEEGAAEAAAATAYLIDKAKTNIEKETAAATA